MYEYILDDVPLSYLKVIVNTNNNIVSYLVEASVKPRYLIRKYLHKTRVNDDILVNQPS